MDPVTAIGLVSAILSFIGFGTKLVRGTIEIYGTADGVLAENRSREAVAGKMKELAARMAPPDAGGKAPQLAGKDKDLCDLAAECRAISEKLVELLGRIKPRDPGRKLQSLWAALRSVASEREREELERRLDYCRGQLELQVAFLTKQSVDSLVESAKKDGARLQALQEAQEQLRQSVQAAPLSPEAAASLRQMLGLHEDALSAVYQDKILRSLAFDSMRQRYDAVKEAHAKTFGWILEPEQAAMRDVIDKRQLETRCEAREKFTGWLSSGRGIFHVSGKLGSGKSTLMKFLSDHPRTKEELKIWAGTRELVFARFFFWRPGAALQKSLAGLYRTLLHDVLELQPRLVADIFPEYWQQAKAVPWQIQTKFEIGHQEIRAAMSRLVESMASYTNHCFCIFIDGLDEYDDCTDEGDYRDLVELLCAWTEALPLSMKLCVSSREHNVFMDAFSSSQRLRLHELTRYDMTAYARTRLDGTGKSYKLAKLVESIVERAQGIFLWVALVVKDMRDQLGDGADLDELDMAIDLLPDDLEKLYGHILGSLSKQNRRKAYQTLTMLPLAIDYELRPSLATYSYFDLYDKDAEFAERDAFVSFARKFKKRERTELGRKRLDGWCKGLVETISTYNDLSDRVDYAHRSIPEFLDDPNEKAKIKALLGDFEPANALSQLTLVEARLRQPGENLLPRFTWVVHMRHEHGLDREPFSFLRCVDSLVEDFDPEIDNGSFKGRIALFRASKVNHRYHDVWLAHTIMGFGNLPAVAPRPFREKNHPGCYRTADGLHMRASYSTLYACAYQGHHEYPLWRIANDPTVTDTTAKAVLLAYASFRSEDSTTILNNLLQRKVLTPETSTVLAPIYRMVRYGRTLWTGNGAESLTIWQHVLLQMFWAGLFSEPELSLQDAGIIKVFLRHGADPRFKATHQSEEKSRYEFGESCGGEAEGQTVFLLGPAGGFADLRVFSLVRYLEALGWLSDADRERWKLSAGETGEEVERSER